MVFGSIGVHLVAHFGEEIYAVCKRYNHNVSFIACLRLKNNNNGAVAAAPNGTKRKIQIRNVKNMSAIWWCVYAYAVVHLLSPPPKTSDVPKEKRICNSNSIGSDGGGGFDVDDENSSIFEMAVRRICSCVQSMHTTSERRHTNTDAKCKSADFYAIPI